MRSAILLLTLLGMAQPSAAQPWRCSFEAVCRAGSPCSEAAWRLSIETGDDGAQLVTTRGTTILTTLGQDSFAGPDMLITIASGGTATLTAHDAPARSYLGHCEDLG